MEEEETEFEREWGRKSRGMWMLTAVIVSAGKGLWIVGPAEEKREREQGQAAPWL